MDSLNYPEVSGQPGPSVETDTSEWNVYPCFMPDDPCVEKIIEWINFSKQSIIVQAYSFNSEIIAKALIRAKQRGVEVEIMIDKNAEKKQNSLIPQLKNQIKIEVDQYANQAHNKVMIIDNEHVITGSYNWTDDEYYNDSDVIVFITDICVTKKYKYNYEALKYQSCIKQYQRNIQNNAYFFTGFNDCRDCYVPFLENLLSNTDKDGFVEMTTKSKKKKQQSENFVKIHVCFPGLNNQNCIELILNHICYATRSIFIQACSLTHEGVLNDLIFAHNRGINIRLLVDKKVFYDKGERVRALINSGIEVRHDSACPSGIAHSKTIIIDNDIVLTGSLNLSYNAQHFNRENLLQMKNIYVNQLFKDKFNAKWNVSEIIDPESLKSGCEIA